MMRFMENYKPIMGVIIWIMEIWIILNMIMVIQGQIVSPNMYFWFINGALGCISNRVYGQTHRLILVIMMTS